VNETIFEYTSVSEPETELGVRRCGTPARTAPGSSVVR
jgi:hypothetical protein